MAIKGVSITVSYFAFNTSTNLYVTGDAANHALRVMKDGVDAAATNAPAEVSSTNRPGEYKLVLTNAEMTANVIKPFGKSSTANVILVGFRDIITEQGILPAGTTAGGLNGLVIVGTNAAFLQVDVEKFLGATPNPLASIPDVVTGIMTDNTAANYTTAGSFGKSLFTGVAPGATGGLAAVGSQMDLVSAPNAAAIAAIQTSNLKRNQAFPGFQFVMVDAVTLLPKAGLVVTCTRNIGDGNGFVTGTLTNILDLSSGVYSVDFGAGDLNARCVTLLPAAAGAAVRFERIITQP